MDDPSEKGKFEMAGDGAKIHELKPRDKRPTYDRWALIDSAAVREDEERINRSTLKRILDVEARHSLPALKRAVVEIERGRRLLAMAGLAGDPDREEEFAAAIDQIADAASAQG